MSRILIVDDEEVDRELATRCLASIQGLTIRYAADGREALDRLAAERPDMVLTDLRMPRMDGLELVEQVRRSFPGLPVVLMTSRGSERMAVRALKAGAASYVPKRFLKRDLGETIEEILDLAQVGRSRAVLLHHLSRCQTRFDLPSDLTLVPALVGYAHEELERIGFGDEAVRDQIGVALLEAVHNSIIHGNLEIPSEVRDEGSAPFHELIRRRGGEPPYASRRVVCEAVATRERVSYLVEDEGPGFDPAAVPDPTAPDNIDRVRGRGLMLIRTFMDQVEFNDRGNQIRLSKASTPGR